VRERALLDKKIKKIVVAGVITVGIVAIGLSVKYLSGWNLKFGHG
jgi:hypothetical protein